MYRMIQLLLCLLMPFSSAFAQKELPRFEVSKKPVVKIPKGQDFIFGYLIVPESRAYQTEKTIKLPVYIFKSRSKTPRKDPIIYTVGGPGSTTMPSAKYMNYYSYLDDRDFILFEQRGTFYAQPHLGCPEWAEAIFKSGFPEISETEKDSMLKEAAIICKEKFTQMDIDLNAYHTHEIAADMADLVKVLNIETYNLLTISYSTKIAQVLMRDYPKGIRSVVMDSPLPLEVNYDEESVKNILEAYEKLFNDCEKDASCDQAFPNLGKRFFDYLTEKTESPLKVSVFNTKGKKEEIFYLQGKDLISLIGTSYTGDIPNIPHRIEQLLSGDLSYIQSVLTSLISKSGYGDGIGMRLSVWCAEELPFASTEIIQQETEKYPAIRRLSPAIYQAEICDIWGVKKVADRENQPIISDIPTLILNGEYDHLTPPKWGELLGRNLSNSHHLIFKGWHHTVTTYWSNPCGMEVARTFFNDPSKSPTIPCFDELQPVNFVNPLNQKD